MIVYVRLYTCKSITKQRSIAATGVLAGSRRVRGFQDCNPHPHLQTPLPVTLQGSPNPCPTLQKGANCARADDTKGMKSAIIDWITPKGQCLIPHIPHNVKSGRGFNHERTGALLCLAGLDWENTEYVTTDLPSRCSLNSCSE